MVRRECILVRDMDLNKLTFYCVQIQVIFVNISQITSKTEKTVSQYRY